MKLKVCGMKYVENIKLIADLKPDYMGFIFYEQSKRNFEGIIPEIPKAIKKTGVFVNEFIEILVSLAQEYQLEVIQLHGDETVAYIKKLKEHLPNVEVIKVFGIKDDFDFSILADYLTEVDYFLFDTKGKERGGNGLKFNWKILEQYPFQKPFLLSGGITPRDVEEIKKIESADLPIYGVDINSQFEFEPGVKNIEDVKVFKNKIM